MQEILSDIGLTGGESRAYLALVRLGESTVGPVSKEASVSLSKIYEVLENLIKKGLVSSITKNNVRHFSASEPERLLDYLELKKKRIADSEEKIRSIIPQLRSSRSKKPGTATLYEGLRGIKTFYEDVLRRAKEGESILAMGVPAGPAKRHEGYFLDWNRRRARKGVRLRIIFNSDAAGLGKKRERIKHTETRYLPKDLVTPAWILVFNDVVATIHLAEKPICVVIEDKSVSLSYRNFFGMLWKSSG